MNTFSRSTNPKDSIGEVLQAQNALHYLDIAHLIIGFKFLKKDGMARRNIGKNLRERETERERKLSSALVIFRISGKSWRFRFFSAFKRQLALQ